MFLRWNVLFLVLSAAMAASPQSQTKTPDTTNPLPTVKSKVRLVLVDVVVANNKGEPVEGLKKQDFEVSEDGKPQVISTFEEHHGAPITQIKLPPMPPNVYTNFPVTQAADSVNVLLLDALNTRSRDQSYVHSQMIQYLKTIPPGTRVAIFTLASRLRMLQGITTDSSQLLAILKQASAGPQSSPLRASDAEADANQRMIDFMIENSAAPNPQTLAQASINPINAMKEFLADTAALQTEARISVTLQALQQMARYLSGIPGRKNVIWFSGSFPTGIFPDSDLPDPFNVAASFQDEIRKTADLLTASQMSLYPIAAEGLATDSIFEANNKEIGQKRPSLAMRDQVRDLQNANVDRDLSHRAMDELAHDTGGRAYYNTNNLADALARVVNDGSRFYSLAYSPTRPTPDGKYHHIQVKLPNGKYTLAYRRGYYADDLDTALAAGQKTDSDPLSPLMGRNLPDYTQILYKILVQPSDPQPPPDATPIGSNPDTKGPFIRYAVDFAIAVGDLKLEPTADGARHGNIEVLLVAYDSQGKPLNLVSTKGDVTLSPEEFAKVQKQGLQIRREIDVPKQYVFLRTGIYDFRSNAAGTLGFPLNNPATPVAK
ncbi:MAG TPA: VWA domain-containing protein [Candidatus Dormibacteraeota bacterium]|nr:VWA domain-containing protein [Candidatus Dormibacteraeota bacterium]